MFWGSSNHVFGQGAALMRGHVMVPLFLKGQEGAALTFGTVTSLTDIGTSAEMGKHIKAYLLIGGENAQRGYWFRKCFL